MNRHVLWSGVSLALFIFVGCAASTEVEDELEDPNGDHDPTLEAEVRGANGQALTARADWVAVNRGLRGDAPTALASDRLLPHVAYAVTARGLYVTWSFGERWRRVLAAEEGTSVSTPVVDPNRAGTAYVTKERILYVTRDAGASWREVGPALKIGAVSPGNSLILWATDDYYGLQKSTDGGLTWSATAMPDPYFRSCCLEVVATSADDVYLLKTNERLYWTRDGGITLSEGTTAGLLEVSEFAVDPDNPEVLYATGYDGRSPYASGLKKSTDGGQTWFRPSAQFTSITPADVEAGADGQVYVIEGSRLFASVDGAATFMEAMEGLESTGALWSVAPHRGLRCLAYALTGTGLFRTFNGGGSCAG